MPAIDASVPPIGDEIQLLTAKCRYHLDLPASAHYAGKIDPKWETQLRRVSRRKDRIEETAWRTFIYSHPDYNRHRQIMSETEGSGLCCIPAWKKRSRKGRESRNRPMDQQEAQTRNDPVIHEAADRSVGQQGTRPPGHPVGSDTERSLGEQEPEIHDQPATSKVTPRQHETIPRHHLVGSEAIGHSLGEQEPEIRHTSKATQRSVRQQGTSPRYHSVGSEATRHPLGEQKPEIRYQPTTFKATQHIGRHAASTGEDPTKNTTGKRSLRDRLFDGVVMCTKFTSAVAAATDLLAPLKAASDILGFVLETVKVSYDLRTTKISTDVYAGNSRGR